MASGSSSHISLTEARSLAAPQPYQLLCQKQDRFSTASTDRIRASSHVTTAGCGPQLRWLLHVQPTPTATSDALARLRVAFTHTWQLPLVNTDAYKLALLFP